MWDNPRSLISFIAGLLLLAMGSIPLLNMIGAVSFALPAFLSGLIGAIVFWILALAGLYLVIESFWEFDEPIGKVALLVGLMILVLGLLPILQQFGVIGFSVPLSAMIYNIIFSIEGILLIISAWNF